MDIKLLSLFSGSGGFELAGAMCGFTPVAASEVEPYPIAVTKSRFPGMKHLGDVSKVNGAELEPVDIITFGSPCTDLSVAGKRAGIDGKASGLFFQAIRIIREMREATNGEYPRFCVWENVFGAFSSNKGRDFQRVLEEIIGIVEPGTEVPAPDKGKWPYADCYMGDGWSVAYRTYDARYWGVPQRRRRIYLVADFRGQCAGEVSFKREGLRGYFAQGGAARKEATSDAGSGVETTNNDVCIPINTMIATRWNALGRGTGFGIGEDGDPQFTISAAHEHAVCVPCILDDQGGQQITVQPDGAAPTLRAEMHGHPPCVMTVADRDGEMIKVYNESGRGYWMPGFGGLRTPAGGGGLIANLVVRAAGFKAGQSMAGGIGWEEEIAATLSAEHSGTEPTVCYLVENHPADSRVDIDDSGTSQTLTSRMGTGGGNVPLVMCIQGNIADRPDTANCNGTGITEGQSYTLNTVDHHAVAYSIGNGQANSLKLDTVAGALDCMHDAQAVVTCAAIDCRNLRETGQVYGTLQAKNNGGQSLNYSGAVRVNYIVRRLTPTECARLQGFPDTWGHPDHKEDFTDEEYAFWMDVRNTHAQINGKAVKQYTKAQMLKWYNALHTDSNEYKMWGNGIALPCALYVMQGIKDAIQGGEWT